MNITSRMHSKLGSFLGRLLTTGVSVWLLGVAFSPALAAVAVDQAPLIIQKPPPPNITLMLDDSGSMAWDYMPDFCYLNGVVCDTNGNTTSSNNDALIDAANNGVYYNPTITYKPPVKADGTSYANATGLTSALVDGFKTSTTAVVDLTAYNETIYDSGNIVYSPYTAASTLTTYTNVSRNQCNAYYSANGASGQNFTGNRFTNGTCTYYARVYSGYFQYSTGAAAGPYTVSYVAATSCGTQSNCVVASDTSGTAAPSGVVAGQNIANWFSYYHTRILMAKSGLMNAFSGVDSTYRVGFGSINGNNTTGLPASSSSTYAFSDQYKSNNELATVQSFGDGTAGTQKANFWNWVAGESASNGTPLRQALGAVGEYYKTDQPWQSKNATTGNTEELACRQSYTILTTDGFWNDSNPGNGNIDGTSATAPITGINNSSYQYTAALPYSDSNSDTLADVAMKYWMTDLRTSAINEVPTSIEDPAFWQHMTTFTLGLGFTPQGIAPTGTTIDQIFTWANGGSAISNFSWPTPAADSINNIADLAHAAVNGHGGFYSATSPQAFSDGLKNALKRAAERVGTGASLAANSTQLKTGAFAYQANYYTAKWKGDLKAIAVDPNLGTLDTKNKNNWSAVTALPAAAQRNIYTYNPSVSTVAAVAFSDPTKLSSTEQSALGSTATDQQNMINYLRGDASMEKPKPGGIYRTRDTALGDIVDSQPVYVGQPDPNQFVGQAFTGSDTYLTYTATTRQGLIFVAANDGMLHAFNADTGAEVYAYLPAAVITTGGLAGGLATLSDPNYGTTTAVPHQYFNDGELTVADVYFGTAWHSVAVGTTGRGLAKAIYALDVTNPANITLLWERSAGDGGTNADYIGQMTGKPVIAQTNDAGSADTTGNGNWSVLIGNGYNSKNGTAALLQFKISDGTLNVHTTDSTAGNGLAAPAVWMNDLSVGISTMAYAGDAQGRVWSFVLNQATVTKVNGVNVTTYAATPTSTGTKLFTAMDAATGGNAQPITGGMLIGKNPTTQDLWVFFGTGQYLSSADLTTTTTQSWYGLIVQSTTNGLAADGTNTVGRSNLKQRFIVAETPGTAAVLNTDGTVKTAAIAPARAVTPKPTTSDMTGKSGWYMDLLSPTSTTASDGTVTYAYDAAHEIAQGERVVTPNQFQGNQLLATTRIPQVTDLCNPSGRGWIMAVDPFTGTNPTSSFFDLNGDGQINQPADYIMVGGKPVATSGMGFSSLPNNPIFMGGSMLVSFDNGNATSIKTSGTSGTLQRVSWRELIAQ
ncbi:pilus assembly protein [Rhodanobacter panaciterrae]|uniref:pilus assembly protein n=1 Tax=Rhodanobacter panaciterrae TaxID=490572 RepID=UPI001673AC40|nr:PilC/PilY family type IV pilus protein [Rhodanobacter panaciterrae]